MLIYTEEIFGLLPFLALTLGSPKDDVARTLLI